MGVRRGGESKCKERNIFTKHFWLTCAGEMFLSPELGQGQLNVFGKIAKVLPLLFYSGWIARRLLGLTNAV